MYKTSFKKYGNKKTSYNGQTYDSKFEAGVARDLEMLKRAGEIKDFESQYRVDIPIYDEHGNKVHQVSHKVDFRVHENDGSYRLVEAKGFETTDYRFRRKLLEKIWLVSHPDHTYEVVYSKRG